MDELRCHSKLSTPMEDGNTHHRHRENCGIILSRMSGIYLFNTNSRHRYLFCQSCKVTWARSIRIKILFHELSVVLFLPFPPPVILCHRSMRPDTSMSPFQESDIAPYILTMWQKHQYTAEQRGIKAKINLPEKPINLTEPGLRWSPEGWWPPLINKKLISKETYTKTRGMMCLKSTLSIACPVSSRYFRKLYSLIEGQCLGFWQTFFKAIHLFGVLVV